jgi:hypothetical protein
LVHSLVHFSLLFSDPERVMDDVLSRYSFRKNTSLKGIVN